MRIARALVRIPVRFVSRVALALRPQAPFKRPWERSVLEDIAARRPWNIRVKWERARAARRIGRLVDGATVVVVNWNTRDVTADVIRAVQRLSPPELRILVVDNGSTDGSRELFAGWPGVETLNLRANAGHGAALDIGVCRVRTRVAVTLDSDAIPLRSGWLDPVLAPVRDGRAVLAGHRSSRDFVHPVLSAVDTAAFVRRGLSFQIFVPPGVDPRSARWGDEAWDTAELMTRRLETPEVVFVEGGEVPVPGLRGGMVAGAVYHYGGVSRETTGAVGPEALAAWREACGRVGQALT